MADQRLALVTGGNRGLGLETCRKLSQMGYQVILTSRDTQKGKTQVEALTKEGLTIDFLPLDVARSQSIEELYQAVEKKWGKLDVLINNAAIARDAEWSKEPKKQGMERIKEDRQILEETLQTNVVGPFEICDCFVPLMRKQGYGRIVNVSSGLGQLSEPHANYAAYSISKTALNAVTTHFASQLKGTNILVNSVCPGWVKTDMGGAEAPRSLDEGVKGIIWAATLPDGGPTGGFFRDGAPIKW